MKHNIFVNREKELKTLEDYYYQCIDKNINCSLLIYGWRRVGKTALLEVFSRRKGGMFLNCSWISDPKTFFRYVLDSMKNTYGELNLIKEYEIKLREKENPVWHFKIALDSIRNLAKHINIKPIVILDEFHIMVEKISYRVARETKKRKDVAMSDIMWLIRDALDSKEAFWILTTSMGWAKIRETYFSEKRKENPLSGVLIKIEIDPLDKDSSVELAKKLNGEIDDEVGEVIYELSGGIPRIIEILAPNYRRDIDVITMTTSLVSRGQFDEIFENIIKFIAEVAKRDYTTIIGVLKALESEGSTAKEVSSKLGIDRVSAYNILEELAKMEIVSKTRHKGRVKYRVLYPLLQTWLNLRISPIMQITQILASELGIMAESYVREMLREYAISGKTLEIYDDEKGTFLAGTADTLRIKIRKILAKREISKRLKGIKNGDIILIDNEDREWLIEIKATLKPITAKHIIKLNTIANKLGIKNKILVQLGRGEIELKAIGEAVKTGTIIITREGVKLLAKKIEYPQY
ncbi:MAG: AAA family ATPase [Candidatus Njordarchaeia archaeon]